MRRLMQNIEVIAHFSMDGKLTPYRLKYQTSDERCIVIKINQVMTQQTDFYTGNMIYVYDCSAVINNIEQLFQIKYELKSCKWFLSKI